MYHRRLNNSPRYSDIPPGRDAPRLLVVTMTRPDDCACQRLTDEYMHGGTIPRVLQGQTRPSLLICVRSSAVASGSSVPHVRPNTGLQPTRSIGPILTCGGTRSLSQSMRSVPVGRTRLMAGSLGHYSYFCHIFHMYLFSFYNYKIYQNYKVERFM